MINYFNLKTKCFEKQKTKSKSSEKIEISKKILDDNFSEKYETQGNNIVYVSVVGCYKIAYLKCDDLLLPEFSNGAYRIFSIEDISGKTYPHPFIPGIETSVLLYDENWHSFIED